MSTKAASFSLLISNQAIIILMYFTAFKDFHGVCMECQNSFASQYPHLVSAPLPLCFKELRPFVNGIQIFHYLDDECGTLGCLDVAK